MTNNQFDTIINVLAQIIGNQAAILRSIALTVDDERSRGIILDTATLQVELKKTLMKNIEE